MSAQEVAELRRQVTGLRAILNWSGLSVDTEPTGDVRDGDYMAFVRRVSAGASSSVVVDFITNDSPPGTDWHGWNKTVHLQSLPLADSVTVAIVDAPESIAVTTPAQMAAMWESEPEYSDMPYYLVVGAGEVVSMWPVPFP